MARLIELARDVEITMSCRETCPSDRSIPEAMNGCVKAGACLKALLAVRIVINALD